MAGAALVDGLAVAVGLTVAAGLVEAVGLADADGDGLAVTPPVPQADVSSEPGSTAGGRELMPSSTIGVVGTLFAHNLSLGGNEQWRLDGCFVDNMPGPLMNLEALTFLEDDRNDVDG